MKPNELWGRFEWTMGSCFRCEQQDTKVAVIGEISARGIDVLITACRLCVFRLEQLHWTLTQRQHLSPTPQFQAVADAKTSGRLRPDGPRPRGTPAAGLSAARWGIDFRLSNVRIKGVGRHRHP
ncbi:hypothetical protein ACFTZI_04990 [Streptomyces decoyicus]|uniref:hypothetical protein n=1 Tax=Streptomyces decoyicus TaxID=249567 RepID=UPI00362C4928